MDMPGETDLLTPVCDEAFAFAYDHAQASFRSHIKSTLALHMACFGEMPEGILTRARSIPLGYAHATHNIPAYWALIALGGDFASAPRLAAVLMCARLAGVRYILPVLFGAENYPPVLLCAMELTGIENAYACNAGNASALVRRLASKSRAGRIFIFPGTEAASLTPLSQTAAQLGISFRVDSAPHLFLDKGIFVDQAQEQACRDTLAWAHPDAIYVEDKNKADVMYCPKSSRSSSPLTLSPDLAGSWIYPDIGPAFFRCANLSAWSDQGDEQGNGQGEDEFL
jgi:hypothetical protein